MHRLLAACIGADVTHATLLDTKEAGAVCDNLNYRHRQAQYAGRASVALNTHVSHYIYSATGSSDVTHATLLDTSRTPFAITTTNATGSRSTCTLCDVIAQWVLLAWRRC